MLLEDLLEQEKREQQQQQPIPTVTPTSAPSNLPPGAQPISSVQPEQPVVPTDPSMVTMNPTMVTGQIVPNQPPNVGGIRPQLPGQLQALQPQRPLSATTVQTFIPRNGAAPGTFQPSQLPPNQRMVNPHQPGPGQQPWPPRHPQEVTLQQRGPGGPAMPQGGMMPMQVASQQQPQVPGASIAGTQIGVPQQIQTGAPAGIDQHPAIRPGLVTNTAGASTPPPPMSNTPAPPTPPENPQTDEDRLKVCFVYKTFIGVYSKHLN